MVKNRCKHQPSIGNQQLLLNTFLQKERHFSYLKVAFFGMKLNGINIKTHWVLIPNPLDYK